MSRAKIASVKTSDLALERMTEHDLLEVVNIEETCGLSLWGWDGYYAELDRPESIMLVARVERMDRNSGWQVIGFIAARIASDELHINNIGVIESARRRGVGSRLLVEALERSALLGVCRAVLEVRASNHAAQSLYGRHGFIVAGRRRNYYKNPAEDALVMASEIKPRA